MRILYGLNYQHQRFMFSKHMKILGDSWNYMPLILVPSPAKRIATKMLVIAKLNGRKYFILSSFPVRNYLFKISNWSTRIRCENCSRLRMKTLERCWWRHSSVFIVNCEHVSSFVLIINFEQANVCCVNVKKINTIEDKIRDIMRL